MKYLIALLVTIGISTFSYAQYYKFESGIQGGTGISYIYYNSDLFNNNHYPIAAYSGSVFLQYNFNSYFSLRTDPGLEREGFKTKVTLTDPYTNTIITEKNPSYFNYMTIPVLFRAGIGNKVRGFVNVGPYIGFLLSEKDVFKNTSTSTITFSDIDSFHKIDAGITSGIGLSIPLKERLYISFEIRKNTGLLNIHKKISNPYPSNNIIRTNSVNVLVGIAYKFGKK